MFTRRTLLAIAAPVLGCGLVVGLQTRPLDTPTRAANEPVLVVDVTGDTLLGPVHDLLAVYSSGNVSYAAAGQKGAQPSVAVKKLEPARIETLMSALSDAGAWQALDQKDWATDVPLTTVTVLSGGTDARAHTFSYWIPSEKPHMQVQAVLAAFVEETFAGAAHGFSTPGH